MLPNHQRQSGQYPHCSQACLLPCNLFWALTLWHTVWCARKGACPRAGSALHAGQGQRRGRSSLSSAFTTLTARRLRRVCSGVAGAVAGTVSCNRLARWRDVSCTASSRRCSTMSRHRLAHSRGPPRRRVDGLARRETTLCQPSSGRCSPGNVRLHSLGHRGRRDSWK